MEFNSKLAETIASRKSHLCVGLDVKTESLPKVVLEEESPFITFNKAIIEATKEYTAAYKLNLAFYEAMGKHGYRALMETLEAIPDDIITIGDAKRADIGSSSEMYARALLDVYGFNSVTVSPYMGTDSIMPFITNPKKGAFVLVLTSNPGAADLQYVHSRSDLPLYMTVAKKSGQWNENGNVGMVLGATKPEDLGKARKVAPSLSCLVPGIGAQGGDLEKVLEALNDNGDGPYLISASRSIIYASAEDDFAEKAGAAAKELRDAIEV